MDLQFILNTLERNSNPNGRLSLLFVCKKGLNYRAYLPEISLTVQENIVSLFQDSIRKKIESQAEEIDFNPSGQEKEQYSVCEYEYVGNYNEVINLYDGPFIEEPSPSEISFIIYRLRINRDEDEEGFVYFFRKNHKLKSIRKGFWISKITQTYNKIDTELIGIDGEIDAISYNSEIAFFSHISAERIFNLREKFTENAQELLNIIKAQDRVQNFDDFEEDCLEDARIIRRLTKIHSNQEIIELFHQQFDNAREVVTLFDLNIDFNDDDTQIYYTSKEQLTDITMLMRDAYYRTVLLERKGIDDFN